MFSSVVKIAVIFAANLITMINFIEELRWRGMLHDVMPGTEELLLKGQSSGYIGFDPTADSLHVGHMVQIMTLVHFQAAGHRPIALVGGATGMIGDPSGKSEERNLLSEEILQHNVACLKSQLSSFLDFESENAAVMVNNYDWFKDFSLLGFLREVGKHLTVNYMMAKDSVKKRLETGISYTEFTYQLIQGYDFYYLWKNFGAQLQMGGSDQWGNITSGTELIRRMEGGEAFALTTPLLTKADGTKFGKSEGGENVWLDPARTSPYKFYQYWLNTSDADAEKTIKIFTLKTKSEIDALVQEHAEAPHLRVLQKALAEDITKRVHGEVALNLAMEASEILFGKGTTDTLKQLNEETFLSVFEGVPMFQTEAKLLADGIKAIDLLVDETNIFPSRGECRKLINGGGLSLNKSKISTEDQLITSAYLLNNKFLLISKGKRNNYLIVVQ